MTFQAASVDRLPIIPTNAKEHNVTCHYCIVGCGYKAYAGRQQTGQDGARQNKFGVDLSSNRAPRRRPGTLFVDVQHRQAGRHDVHLVIKPDPACAVNSGLGSVQGARVAENTTRHQARGFSNGGG